MKAQILFFMDGIEQFSNIKDIIHCYITGFIMRKLLKTIYCSTCADYLIKQSSKHNYS